MYRAFFSELEKIAVDTLELAQRTLTAPGVRTSTPQTIPALRVGPAFTRPTAPQSQGIAAVATRPLTSLVNKLPLPQKMRTGLNTSAVSGAADMIAKRQEATMGGMPHGGIVVQEPSRVPLVARRTQPRVQNASAVASLAGKPTSFSSPWLKYNSPIDVATTNNRFESAMARTGVFASHELAERSVHPRNIHPFYSHLSPEVLLKERNTVARLTGPGSENTKNVMNQARGSSGEAQHLKNLMTSAFKDPRAAQFLEGNEKVPKAMRKALNRRLAADPGLIARTHPDAALPFMQRMGKNLSGLKDQLRILQKLR